MYASSSWWGYAGTEQRVNVDSSMIRMKRRKFLLKETKTATDLTTVADQGLFPAIFFGNPITWSDRVLRELASS